MQPNAAQTALARRGWARLKAGLGGLLIAGLLSVPALAGDRAGIDFIGYSPDGRYFAFDEFGIQDGSGFAYANLYVLDVKADQWVAGTPLRVQHDDEDSTIAAVRAEVLAEARPALEQLAIGTPVDILALNGDGAPGADDPVLRFGRLGYGMAAPDPVYELRLSPAAVPLNRPDCADWGESEVTGFALSLVSDGQSRDIYRDRSVPLSRGCPQGYRLYAVVAPFDSYAGFGPARQPGLVAIIAVYSLGFEGPDRRFIAVPIEP